MLFGQAAECCLFPMQRIPSNGDAIRKEPAEFYLPSRAPLCKARGKKNGREDTCLSGASGSAKMQWSGDTLDDLALTAEAWLSRNVFAQFGAAMAWFVLPTTALTLLVIAARALRGE